MGLSDRNTALFAGLFVIGEALERTRVAQGLSSWQTAQTSASAAKLIFLRMVIVTGVGSCISSTGVVAIFIPGARRPHCWLVDAAGNRHSTFDLAAKGWSPFLTGIGGEVTFLTDTVPMCDECRKQVILLSSAPEQCRF